MSKKKENILLLASGVVLFLALVVTLHWMSIRDHNELENLIEEHVANTDHHHPDTWAIESAIFEKETGEKRTDHMKNCRALAEENRKLIQEIQDMAPSVDPNNPFLTN